METQSAPRRPSKSADGVFNVWILDKHPLLRTGLKSQLERGRFRVTYEGCSLCDALPLARGNEVPDLVLLDLELGFASVPELKEHVPSCRLIVMGFRSDIRTVSQCFASGADGAVLKSISPEALLDACNMVMHGEKLFPGFVAQYLASLSERGEAREMPGTKVGALEFSDKELAVLKGLATGQTNKNIANALGVTEASVKVQLKAVMRKLGSANRTQAAIWAIQNNLTPADSIQCPSNELLAYGPKPTTIQ